MVWGAVSANTCTQHGRPCRSNLDPGRRLDREEHSCGPKLPALTRGPLPSLCSCCRCTKTQPLRCDTRGEEGARPSPPPTTRCWRPEQGTEPQWSRPLGHVQSTSAGPLTPQVTNVLSQGLSLVNDPGKGVSEHIPTQASGPHSRSLPFRIILFIYQHSLQASPYPCPLTRVFLYSTGISSIFQKKKMKSFQAQELTF